GHGQSVEVVETAAEDPVALVDVPAHGRDAGPDRPEAGQGGTVALAFGPGLGGADELFRLVDQAREDEGEGVQVVPRPVAGLVDVDLAGEGDDGLRGQAHGGVVAGGGRHLHPGHGGGDDLDRVGIGAGGEVAQMRGGTEVVPAHRPDDGAGPV